MPDAEPWQVPQLLSMPCRRDYEKVIEEYSEPKEGSQPLHFPSQYATSTMGQYKWLVWRYFIINWRLTECARVLQLSAVICGSQTESEPACAGTMPSGAPRCPATMLSAMPADAISADMKPDNYAAAVACF